MPMIDTAHRFSKCLYNVTGSTKVELGTRLFEARDPHGNIMDSLEQTELIMMIEDEFNIVIDQEEAPKLLAITLSEVLDWIDQRRKQHE